MPDINLNKSNIPFWAGGDGTLQVHVSVPDITKPLSPADTNLFSVSFNLQGAGQTFSIGSPDDVKLGIKAGSSVTLVPLWASSSPSSLQVLGQYGIADYFTDHSDRLLLILTAGASADATVDAKLNYLSLSASATLDAGANGGYALIRSYPTDTIVVDLVDDFFKALRLPGDVDKPLDEGEVITLDYGGYLKFGGTVGAGYSISGSPSFQINQLQLAEKYGFSVLGTVGLDANVAGQFEVKVSQGSEAGWVRVVVSKNDSRGFKIAADVSASATFQQEGLPSSADELLEAVIGVNAKNWLNLFNQIQNLTDFKNLDAYLDNLAKSFIEEYVGKAFDELAKSDLFNDALARVREVANQYNNAGDNAVALFDKYFDVGKGEIDQELTDALNIINNATSWDSLKSRFSGVISPDNVLWRAVEQLTGGDPLGWALGKINIGGVQVNSLDELKTRADGVLNLIEDDANAEIRKVIALAKSKFPYNGFVQELGQIDLPTLKSMTDKRLTGFVERMIDQSLDKLSDSDLGKAVTRFHQVLDSVENFKNSIYAKLKQSLSDSVQFTLNDEYSRADDETALIDFELDLTTDAGKSLMNQAGRGDFSGVLAGYGTGAVKLNEGVLTHKVTRQSSFSINIVGWHLGWNYQGLDRVITESDQRIQANDGSQLTIITTLDLQKERERKRNGERVYTNFLLRFIGEANGAVQFDEASHQYLIETITNMAASYELVIQDPDTTPQELSQYLSFAADFGLVSSETEAETELVPLLPKDGQGNFGNISITYDARFTEDGLKSLFTKPFDVSDEQFLRLVMRKMVLANYLKQGPVLANRAWCYWTPGIQKAWAQGQAAFTNNSSLTFNPIAPSPFKNLQAPAKVTLPQSELFQLSTLYFIEASLVKGFVKLAGLVQSKTALSPRDFENALGDFGNALKLYDNFDAGENTVFALFDSLVARDSDGKPFRNSSLTLTSTVNGQEMTKMLTA